MSTDFLEGLDRETLMAELGGRMSRIAEAARCTSWHHSTAEEVPRACYEIAATGKPGQFDSISMLTARLLIAIAERLGHWVVPKQGELGWEPYVPKAMKRRESRTGHASASPPKPE